MERNHFEAFVPIVRRGGFTRAAATLHLSHPAISRRVIQDPRRPAQPARLGSDSTQECIPVLFSSKATPSPQDANEGREHDVRDVAANKLTHEGFLGRIETRP